MTIYEVHWYDWDETIEAASMAEAIELAEEMTREGDWGDHGARVDVGVIDPETDAAESLVVEVPPNHAALIRDAAKEHDLYGWRDLICGTDPNAHDWTGEGEGGCDSNPGVWATGGTSLLVRRHCRRCSLAYTERSTGGQYDPGECDTIEYELRDPEPDDL